MAAGVTREKGNFPSFEGAADVGIGGRAEGSLQPQLFHFRQPRHGIEPAAADDSDFRLQIPSEKHLRVKLLIIQDAKWRAGERNRCGMVASKHHQAWRYNSWMRFCGAIAVTVVLCCFGAAQQKPTAAPAVTVPLTLDHNRIIIDVDVRLSDGSTQRVHAWVDNGIPDLYISRRLATSIACDGQTCSGPAPEEMMIGAMTIPLGGRIPGAGIKEAKILLHPDEAESRLAPGMTAEINIPSIVLRRYDVLIDFPGHKFSIGAQGTIQFLGSSAKVKIDANNGSIQVPSQIENKKYNLALDLGSCVSFLSNELFDRLQTAHPDWPHMTGAVGSANMWGIDGETSWTLMRVDRMQVGPLFLTEVAVVELPTTHVDFISEIANATTAGLIGANSLMNYRVGLDYAHSMVYFDIGRLFNFPEFDVVGLILRPEVDGRFTILGVADVVAKPVAKADAKISVPQEADGVLSGDQLIAVDDIPVRGETMGQVWAMLGGTPGQERGLTVERAGKRFVVSAQVEHFLGELTGESEKKKKKNK